MIDNSSKLLATRSNGVKSRVVTTLSADWIENTGADSCLIETGLFQNYIHKK